MRAVLPEQPGGPEVLQVREIAAPTLVPGHVIIAVHAAGVNRPDVLQRKGLYPPPPGASPVPEGWSMVEAASLPETLFTVWSNVVDRGQLQPGQWLLVHGGTSGIGVTAIQVATALGAHVLATAGTADKCRACERLGAVRGIDYREQDFVAVVNEVTQGRGVDVVLDMVAGTYVERELGCLADDGRVVVIATLGGAKATLPLPEIMRRRLTITGSTLRARPVPFKAAIARALEAQVWPWLVSRQIGPVVDSVFALADAEQAHARMESGAHIGKIVLQVV